MQIYATSCFGKVFEKLRAHELGMLIPAHPDLSLIKKQFKEVPCALDNGMWLHHNRGHPFNPQVFFNCLARCTHYRIPLDFVVVPDILAGGMDSLAFSIFWARYITPGPHLALVVQDGMQRADVEPHLPLFEWIFVGGTKPWKWQTAAEWVAFAHDHGKRCHIGAASQPDHMDYCREIGADAIDSSTAVRNNYWGRYTSTQLSLFPNGEKTPGTV